MFKDPSPSGFAVAPRDERAPCHGTLPALIATLSLVFSIAVVLTAVTMSAARAAQLF
jgi:hypothetical protein